MASFAADQKLLFMIEKRSAPQDHRIVMAVNSDSSCQGPVRAFFKERRYLVLYAHGKFRIVGSFYNECYEHLFRDKVGLRRDLHRHLSKMFLSLIRNP